MHKVLGILLLIGILPLPYGYYLFLRVIVFLGAIYLSVTSWKTIGQQTKGILVVLIVLFNPIAPIFLNKLLWIPIDLIAAIYLFRFRRHQALNVETKTMP